VVNIQRGSAETPIILESLAHALARSGRHSDSAILLGAAGALRQRAGLKPMNDEQINIDAALAAIHHGLPGADVQGCLSDGARLTERELLALAESIGSISR
jgi:hypothetical protein